MPLVLRVQLKLLVTFLRLFSYDCCACRCYVIGSFFCSVFYYYIYLTFVMDFVGMAT
jgi:hypothetical protein